MPQQSRHSKCRVAGLSIAALFVLLSPTYADMQSGKQTVLDFTKPQEIRAMAHWSDPRYVKATKEGLGWDPTGQTRLPRSEWHRLSRDVWVETTEPIAIGWSWRPVYSVRVRAERVPPGEFKFGENSVVYPSGQLFARYSPDAVHWSTWQVIKMQVPRDKSDPKQTYEGSMRVPYRERERYTELCREYAQLDVPWASDEEAAVRWILEKEPDFFERGLSFIGYVQFLYEMSLQGNERISELRFGLSYGAGGMHAPPRDASARQDREGPWRFKADGPRTEIKRHKNGRRTTDKS